MRVEQVFREFIERKGQRYTRQREVILSVFMKKEGHLSAEELYDAAKKKDTSLGQATVYRNLKLLVAAGIAREVYFGDGAARYEHKIGHEHHDHIICDICGKQAEVLDERIEKLQVKLADKHGYKLTGHRMYLYGICKSCGVNKD